MRSALLACMIMLVTALSMLAVASPGMGKGGSHDKSDDRSVRDDDDDSGGDSDRTDDDDDDDGGGAGRKGDRGGKKNDAPLTPEASDSPSNGSSRSDSIEEDSPPSPPSVGERVNVVPQGEILVKLPSGAAFVPLGGAASLPNGSLVDARYGSITLTSASDRGGATQTATFRGAVFQILQDARPRPVTELVLKESEDATSCELRRAMRTALAASGIRTSRAGLRVRRYLRQGSPTSAAHRRRGRKGLWSNGRGRFRTRGRHGAASVRGTRWLTEERCEGTFFMVTRGVVTVEDFLRDRTVTLRPGDSYLARSRR